MQFCVVNYFWGVFPVWMICCGAPCVTYLGVLGIGPMLCLNLAPQTTQESVRPDLEAPCPQLVFD